MKSERTYPVYKVNKHAEGLLVGGHPWVYENDILSFPQGRLSRHRFSLAAKQDPGAAHFPQRQRYL